MLGFRFAACFAADAPRQARLVLCIDPAAMPYARIIFAAETQVDVFEYPN